MADNPRYDKWVPGPDCLGDCGENGMYCCAGPERENPRYVNLQEALEAVNSLRSPDALSPQVDQDDQLDAVMDALRYVDRWFKDADWEKDFRILDEMGLFDPPNG